MKRMRIIGLVMLTTIGIAAVAAEPNQPADQSSPAGSAPFTLDIPKEVPALVMVKSGDDVVSEMKTTQAGTLKLQANLISWRIIPKGGGGRIYTCDGAAKAEFEVQGKLVFTLSGEQLVVQPANTNAPVLRPRLSIPAGGTQTNAPATSNK